MTDHQNANTERRPQRRGRASFVAVLDEVRKEHERGVPLVWIYEAYEISSKVSQSSLPTSTTGSDDPVMAKHADGR